MTESKTVPVPDYVILEIVLLCHAALAQDSPETPSYYLNQILGMAMGPLPHDMRPQIEEYLAEKKYLPPSPKIEIAK